MLANTARTRVASAGDAVAFASLAGFGDVQGTGISTDYLAERSSDLSPGGNGWSTHAITPPQQSLSFLAAALGLEPAYEGDLSPDLSHGILRAWSLLAPAPNVSLVENLYLRTDLRSAAGSYQLLSDAVAPVGSPSPLAYFLDAQKPGLAGTSADFSHVLFESAFPLTTDATGGGPWLYESSHGTLSVAGVLPDGTVVSGATAGRGARDHFYTPHTISSDGLKIFFTDPSTGTLYMRKTDSVTSAHSTVQLNASERTDCADHNPCNGTPEPSPSGQQPATYWDASASGDRVFFSTQEALTDDAPPNGNKELYMYDTSKPDSDPHNLTFISPDHQPADAGDVDGVIGASTDGHYVYFTAAGQLVAGAPDVEGAHGVYLWHDGTVSYVGELRHAEALEFDLPSSWSLGPSDARVTPDGRNLLFESLSGVGLTGYDHGSCESNPSGQCREIYVYSADSGGLSCASCIPSGAPATADAWVQVRQGGPTVTTSSLSRAISDDGRRVFFTTAEALVPQDTNSRTDAYEYDVPSRTVRLLSSGKSTSDSYFLSASPSGEDAFILTREQLVGWDTDSAYDLYDVRVGGGFVDPARVAACAGEACHGAAATAAGFDALPTAQLAGTGNLPPSRSPAHSASETRAQKLIRALRACRRRPKARRRHCESLARRRFGRAPGRRGRR